MIEFTRRAITILTIPVIPMNHRVLESKIWSFIVRIVNPLRMVAEVRIVAEADDITADNRAAVNNPFVHAGRMLPASSVRLAVVDVPVDSTE